MKVMKLSFQKLYLNFQPDGFTGPVVDTHYDTALYLACSYLAPIKWKGFSVSRAWLQGQRTYESLYLCFNHVSKGGIGGEGTELQEKKEGEVSLYFRLCVLKRNLLFLCLFLNIQAF